MSVERIVRPFQKVDTSPTKSSPPVVSTGLAAPVINRWGENGEVKQYSASVNISQTYYVIRRPIEVKGGTDRYVDEVEALPEWSIVDDLTGGTIT